MTIGSRLSATFASAEIGAKEHPGREIHVVDSMAVSMGVGHLAMLGVELAAAGRTGAAVAATLRERAPDLDLYVAFDTLEYVRKGGRLSPARAAIGTMLSVKPIITVVDGLVETADRVRTRAKARERVIQLLTARPVERIAILHTGADDLEGFRETVVGRLPGGVDPAYVSVGQWARPSVPTSAPAPWGSRPAQALTRGPQSPLHHRAGRIARDPDEWLRDGYGPGSVPLRSASGPFRPGPASPFGTRGGTGKGRMMGPR